MVNDFNQKTALRTRRMPFRPSPEGDAEHGEYSQNILPIGTHLGEFEILDLIGEGGFGIVYLAYDHSLERQVALKEYMPSGLAKRTTRLAVTVRSQHNRETFTAGLKSFINEARILAQFDAQSLVKVHRFWEGNGTAYMVMPFYDGITLKQALKQRRITPTESWIRTLLADLFDAIDIIHQAHCLHRDIAPDNILLLKDGRPLLLDFGAARRVIGDLTQCLTAILKPGYAPIEQYADIAGLRQGPWTDIYALAAVVYYLIAGKAPPPAVARMVHDELVPAREVGKGRYSAGLLAAIDKALSVKPEQRFRTIAELHQALDIMEPAPRTAPPGEPGLTTTMVRADSNDDARTRMALDMMPDVKTRIAPPPTQRSERRVPPSGMPPAASAPRIKREWVILGALLTAGVVSGVYLGTGPSWKNLPFASTTRDDSHAKMASSGASEVPGQDDERKHADSSRPMPSPSSTTLPADTGSQQAQPQVSPPLAKLPPQSLPATQTPLEQRPEALVPSREDEAWRQASMSDKAGAYEKYLREYPNGRYAAIARLRLEAKQPKEEASSREEDWWTSTTAIDTQSAYETYLRKYPKGRYAPLAKDRIAAMKRPKAAVREEPAAPPTPPAVARSEPSETSPVPAAPPAAPAAGAPAPAPASATTSTADMSSGGSSQASVAASSGPESPAERKNMDSSDKLALVNPAEKGLANVPKTVPPESASPRKPLVLADQTMLGDFSVDPKTGVVSGTGKIVWTNGNQFEGTLVHGRKEGKGKFAWSNGQRYSGDWARDMPNGRGVITFSDGSRYEGDVKDGMPHGQGATRFKSGDVYEGNWVRGKSHGHGRYTWANGSYWEGEFRDDKRTDNGKMVYAEQAAGNAAQANESSGAGEAQSADRRAAPRESPGN